MAATVPREGENKVVYIHGIVPKQPSTVLTANVLSMGCTGKEIHSK